MCVGRQHCRLTMHTLSFIIIELAHHKSFNCLLFYVGHQSLSATKMATDIIGQCGVALTVNTEPIQLQIYTANVKYL